MSAILSRMIRSTLLEILSEDFIRTARAKGLPDWVITIRHGFRNALLPVLTSRGRGADVMVPMAIPSFGGMTLALMTMFTVPVLWCLVEERRLRA